MIFSYYAVIAGWVLAYTWKCGAGLLSNAGPEQVGRLWDAFRASPYEVAGWHVAFVALVVAISGRGLRRGIEVANKIRGPGLLLLLLILVVYSLSTGDVHHGLAFAFTPRISALNPQIVLAAIGQAFYATGVGQAMMMAYGAYIERGTSLVRTSLITTAAILFVSLLATLMIYPLVFAYGMNPAQGPELVFEVLPRAFAEMRGGRIIGTLFFMLLVLAALMPSVASLEPVVAWLTQRHKLTRMSAVGVAATAAWLLGIGSVLSFNVWAAWYPLKFVPPFGHKTFFDLMDYVSANIMLPAGALLTSILVGWRLKAAFMNEELVETVPLARIACRTLLRYLCPAALLAVFIATLT
jgi:NSS family neurotransmitter:Na+ symporter